MTQPRLLRAHCLPPVGDPAQARVRREYVLPEAIPGSRQVLKHVWPLAADTHGPEIVDVIGATTRNRITVGRNTGGAIQEWEFTPANGAPATKVQWLNHWDRTGRQLQAALFFPGDGGVLHNPTQAGGQIGGQDPGVNYALPAGYVPADLVHGSPLVEYATGAQQDGSHRIAALAVPGEWEAAVSGQLTAMDPLFWIDLRLGYELLVNWHGIEGVHRHLTRVYTPQPLPADAARITLSVPTLTLRAGFDKLYAWQDGAATRLDGVEIYGALAGSVSSVSVLGDLVIITLTAPHGRVTGTSHDVTIAGTVALSGASINGTRRAGFQAGNQVVVNVPGAGSYQAATGTVAASAIPFFDWTSNAALEIGGDTLEHELGGGAANLLFPGKTPLGGAGRAAVIARVDGTQAWSLGGDFAIASYGYLPTGTVRSVLRANMAGMLPAASNSADAFECLGSGVTRYWEAGNGLLLPAGESTVAAFLVMGTYDEVLARLELLDEDPGIDTTLQGSM